MLAFPPFNALLIDRTGEISHLGQGSGCHPASEIALSRALTEAVQVRTTYIAGSREDILHQDYDRATLDARARSARFLMRPAVTMRRFGAVGSRDFEDLETEVAWIVERLRAAGIGQVATVDLTHAELGVPVARVVVPGLEGSDHIPDYSPGARARAIEREMQ